MNTSLGLDLGVAIEAITAALAARSDPAYEAGMRRTVPSLQPAHATRVPEIRKVASEWRKSHRDAATDDVLAVCDALWATGWREERMVAISIIEGSKGLLENAGWQRCERWSADIDNWEHVDHLANLSGRLLVADPALLSSVKDLESSSNPWQRRLALVTLIVAFMKGGVQRDELSAMATRLQKDVHPLVRRAVVWARDRLGKDHHND